MVSGLMLVIIETFGAAKGFIILNITPLDSIFPAFPLQYKVSIVENDQQCSATTVIIGRIVSVWC